MTFCKNRGGGFHPRRELAFLANLDDRDTLVPERVVQLRALQFHLAGERNYFLGMHVVVLVINPRSKQSLHRAIRSRRKSRYRNVRVDI